MKNIAIDFSHLGDLCGFGNIAKNFSKTLVEACPTDFHLIFVVPERFVGTFGNNVDYVRREQIRKDLARLNKPIHLWHATDQQFRYRHRSPETIQLLTVHDLNFLYEKKYFRKWRHQLKLKWDVKKSDYITVISHYVQKEMAAHVDMSRKGCTVIHNGIDDPDVSKAERPDFIGRAEEKFFFTIGQIREKKNFHKLIPMMRYFPDYKLFICGDDHFKYARELRRLIDEHGQGRCILVGKIDESHKIWLYQHCRGFFFPSRLEGFGIPVLEAMRFRCKVFASRLSSLPEVCGHYADYWEHFEPEYMANVVKNGLVSWDRNSRKADEIVDYALSFNYESYTKQYISLYRKLLAERL
ncbi:MAG: glycosyltransferase family 4 protein [Prevotella sp.]|nr:glycosyltransferase family 4 protein [Prevotella sp.]